ncbi:MspI family type II restriction endonuclease [Exiguobacterium sp. 17-1]|uniref:MspI family type II restriction endonuclease n=1 Tax=Exiguobacterium sp. 17-1 TaxID=2931981 RepID=UPI001FFF123B|nr:MspI family type II restriction endonuclease [Exiguobacterium sp. 17-1]MCK2158630.1 MspI family type II restriction endonuclease [Exiguobacterium sp. 17-1]
MNIYKDSRNMRGALHSSMIEILLDKLLEKKYIKNFLTKPRIGYASKKKQFHFSIEIEFLDGEKWLIQTSTSYPRERINGYQWNALNFKKIDSSYKKALIVYPDMIDEKEVKKFESYKSSIDKEKILSEIDNIVSFTELYFLIEEKWLEKEKLTKVKALQGTAFEKLLVDILSSKHNLNIWNQDTHKEIGFYFPYFYKIISKFGIHTEEKIIDIKATNIIPKLKNNHLSLRSSNPKTDLIVKIFLKDSEKTFTISSKRTSSKWVAVHQYPASSFIEVLNIKEEPLKYALNELQQTGAPTQISDESIYAINQYFPKYYEKLTEWAYCGIGGVGTGVQNAEYFTVYKNDTKELMIYHKEEYINKILTEVKNGQFNSPFQFTYTGERGASIQLKGKVL